MPEVPRNHPAIGLITLNFAANGLGLDNAATPIGLRAMRELQSLNPKPDTASNAQILFLVLNASSLTLLPVSCSCSARNRARRSDAGVPAHSAGHLRLHAGRIPGGGVLPAPETTDPVVLAWLGAARWRWAASWRCWPA